MNKNFQNSWKTKILKIFENYQNCQILNSPKFPKSFQIFLLSFLFAIAATSPLPDHPAPAPYPAEPVAPPVYNFKYAVDDSPYGPVFSHGENRENYNTAGEYQVNLPDGRVQIVTYKVSMPHRQKQ